MKEKKDKLYWDQKLASFYSQTGYAEIEMYNEPEYDLMNYEGQSEHAIKFNLKKGDMLAIIKALKQSAAYQRASQKSMTTSRTNTIIDPKLEEFEDGNTAFKDTESLIYTRHAHMEEVAEIAGEIANGIGANFDLSFIIGLTHDIGHTPEGHYGERIFSSIGRLNDCLYMVHPAMGAYILEREHIIKDAIDGVVQLNPNVDLEEVKRFMRYVVDGIVSHNGEGTIGKIIPKDKTTEEMIEEIRGCFTEKGYDKKIMPATIEGAIIRYADILAYTRSDLVDGFRLRLENGDKILNNFNDDYLAVIGTVIARQNNYNKMLTLENKFLLELYGLSKKIEQLGKDAKTAEDFIELKRTKKERDIIQAKYNEFCSIKIEYAKDYISKLKPNEVKTKIPALMQNVFIKDLVETSRDKEYITMSPLMRRTFFALRDLNFKYVVPYTRRGYLKEMPIPTNELVDLFSNSLIKSGNVYDVIPEEDKKKYGLEGKEGYSRKMDSIVGKSKINYEIKMFHYYDNLPKERKYEIYENAVKAMKDITYHDIKIALGEEKYDGELKETYEFQKIMPIKKRINELGEYAKTEEGQKKLFDEIVKEKMKNIEKIVASKMAIEYLGGMTDNTLIAVLLNRGLLSREYIIKNYGRPAKDNTETKEYDKGLVKLQQAYNEALDALIEPDDIPEDQIRL